MLIIKKKYFEVAFVMSLLIILLLLYIPVAGIGDLLYGLGFITRSVIGFRGGSLDLLTQLILAGREVILLVLYGLFFLSLVLSQSRLIIPNFLIALLFVVGYSALISLFLYSPLFCFAGLRGMEYFPLVVILPVLLNKHPKLNDQMNSVILLLFILEVVVCVLQTRLLPPFEGVTFFGSRTVGTFNNPNTIGAVFAFMTYWILFLIKPKRKYLWIALSIIGILTTGSRTAMIIEAFVIFIFIFKNIRKNVPLTGMFLILSTIAFLVLYMSVGKFSGRGDLPTLAHDNRVLLVKGYFQQLNFLSFLFGNGLGVGTNTIHIFPQLEGIGIISVTDSMFLSYFVQFGFVGFCVFQLFFWSISKRSGERGIILFLVVSLISFGSNWFEVYPFNLLVMLTYGLLLAQNNSAQKNESLNQLY